jgi:hypothetical protein
MSGVLTRGLVIVSMGQIMKGTNHIQARVLVKVTRGEQRKENKDPRPDDVREPVASYVCLPAIATKAGILDGLFFLAFLKRWHLFDSLVPDQESGSSPCRFQDRIQYSAEEGSGGTTMPCRRQLLEQPAEGER